MKKMPKVLAAILAVGFAVVGLAAAPASTVSAAPVHHAMLDTGWGP